MNRPAHSPGVFQEGLTGSAEMLCLVLLFLFLPSFRVSEREALAVFAAVVVKTLLLCADAKPFQVYRVA